MAAGEQGWIAKLTGDVEIAALFEDQALIASFARFESALVAGLAAAGRIDGTHAHRLIDQIDAFTPDSAAIAEAAVRDGVPVPEYVRQLRDHVSGPGREMLHFGATSQDLVDTAMVEAATRVSVIVTGRLDRLIAQLDQLEARDGGNALQAITRMQPALRFRAADRLNTWRRPLQDLRNRLGTVRERMEMLQFGGATGDLQALGSDAATVAAALADHLKLRWPGHSWHSDRGALIGYAGWLTELSGALGKIGQDVALMALRGETDIALSGGGSSSAMPHKQNPVAAERLVALARFNANLAGAMYHTQINEMERSGAAWTLEWMIFPQICETTGAALNAATTLIQSINRMGEPS
jgi:3-carboxy-cis,cis-muconate cycloisomerase